MRSLGLGDVTPGALLKEAARAEETMIHGASALAAGRTVEATKHLIASVTIAVNVLFTARTHDVKLPQAVMNRMQEVGEKASRGIQKAMRLVADQKISKHNRLMHAVPRVTIVKTAKPLELWFRMTKKGIPLRNLRVVPAGIAVTGRTLAEVKRAIER